MPSCIRLLNVAFYMSLPIIIIYFTSLPFYSTTKDFTLLILNFKAFPKIPSDFLKSPAVPPLISIIYSFHFQLRI